MGTASDLIVERCAIPDVCLIRPVRHNDARGFFSEVYSRRSYAAACGARDFVQDNYSRSRHSGVVRGLHFQIPPFAQDKLVWASRGAIFSVAVDLRRRSAFYGRHVAKILSAESWCQLLIPAGFAHGFCVMEQDTDVTYKVSAYYSPAHEHGLLWNDPALAIPWPIDAHSALMSERDRKNPMLAELPPYFTEAVSSNGTMS